MSNGKEERDIYYIPGNFLTSGRLFGGMIRVRNAIEACALVLLTGLPIINLGISLTARVIILCLITLPLGVFGVVGIEGDSLSEFVINWFKWLCNRRVLYRSDTPAKQEPEKPQRIVRSVAPGGAPELEKELLAIFERTYGQIKRRDVLPMMALRSQDKKELLARMEPAEEFVLVDGYNIIFAWDELKEIGRDSLDAARHVLMNLLCNYQGYRGCNLILVFDAYKVKGGLGSVEKYHNITIVYTKEAETADAYIERATYEIGRQHRVRVATSDGPEQIIILGHGALRLSASAFHEEMMEVQKQIGDTVWQNNRKNANSGAVRAAMEKAKEGGGC